MAPIEKNTEGHNAKLSVLECGYKDHGQKL